MANTLDNWLSGRETPTFTNTNRHVLAAVATPAQNLLNGGTPRDDVIAALVATLNSVLAKGDARL